MDGLLLFLVIALAAAPLALLGGWFAGRGYGELGPLMPGADEGAWQRSEMPWPRGVQEEEPVRWGLSSAPDQAADRVTPVRLQPRVRRRPPAG
jgi:hypothetical protein